MFEFLKRDKISNIEKYLSQRLDEIDILKRLKIEEETESYNIYSFDFDHDVKCFLRWKKHIPFKQEGKFRIEIVNRYGSFIRSNDFSEKFMNKIIDTVWAVKDDVLSEKDYNITSNFISKMNYGIEFSGYDDHEFYKNVLIMLINEYDKKLLYQNRHMINNKIRAGFKDRDIEKVIDEISSALDLEV